MIKNNNFALVPRTSGVLEKAEPGAKRILSSMVADTLALVKRELRSKRDVHVLMAGSPEFNEFFPFIVSMADDRLKAHFDFHFHSCQRMDELAAAVKQCNFDLALVQLHNAPPVEHRFTDKREVLLRVERLLAENYYIVWAGLEVASFLHSVHGIPVVMVSDTGGEEAEKLLAVQVGARALFPWLHMDIQAFCECLRGILNDVDKPAQTRQLRIVVVDDDEWLCEMVKAVISANFKNFAVQTFQSGEQAWQELLRADPDFLITDIVRAGMTGYEMLPLLAERKVRYPILVTSGYAKEQDVRECAGTHLNLTFWPKPYRIEQLTEYLIQQLGSTRLTPYER